MCIRDSVFPDYKPQIVENDGAFYEDKLIHRTARGEMVRSKSEVIIANALFLSLIHILAYRIKQ